MEVITILYLYPQEGHTYLIHDDILYECKKTCHQILDELCYVYGSTLEGRRKVFADRMMIVQMVPILVSRQDRLLFFPLVHENTYWWINYYAIQMVKRLPQGESQIIFDHDHKITLMCDIRSVRRQIHRCQLYDKILMQDSIHAYLQQLNSIPC